MKTSNAGFTFSSGKKLFGQVRQGHRNWGDMKDVLREVNKYQRDPSLLFLVSPSGLFHSLYLFKLWREGGDGERVVYGSQLETDRTFRIHCVLCVRKCSSWSKSLRKPPPFPVLGLVCGRLKGSPVHSHICCLKLPYILFESGT